jgi:hypothetical protein
VPDLPVLPAVPVADSFQIAKDNLFPADDGLWLDRRQVAFQCVHGLRVDGPDQLRQALAAVRASLADVPEDQAWFDATFANHPFRPAPPVQLRSPHLGFDGQCLHLSADQFGVEDVYGAAALCEKVLNYRADPAPELPAPAAPQLPAPVAPSSDEPGIRQEGGLRSAVRRFFDRVWELA